MEKDQFDVQMQVLFCDKHKKTFEEIVKIPLKDDEVGIRPSELISLWRESETCINCEWKTTFGRSKIRKLDKY